MKKHMWNKILLTVAAFLFVWAIWQHEIMMFPYMAACWNGGFQFFTGIVVPWGAAYDFTLLLVGACFLLSNAALWFWED